MSSSFSSSSPPAVVGLLGTCEGCMPAPHSRPRLQPGSRSRLRRVLYPPRVRKTMPKEHSDPVRRWLLFLSTLLFLQIYTEDDPWEPASSAEPQAQNGFRSLGERASEGPLGASGADGAPCWGPNTCCQPAQCPGEIPS